MRRNLQWRGVVLSVMQNTSSVSPAGTQPPQNTVAQWSNFWWKTANSHARIPVSTYKMLYDRHGRHVSTTKSYTEFSNSSRTFFGVARRRVPRYHTYRRSSRWDSVGRSTSSSYPGR